MPQENVETVRSIYEAVNLLGAFEEWAVEPQELLESGDQVVAVLGLRARPRGSSAAIENRTGQLWTIHDGKARSMRMFPKPEKALEAAGLSEQPMSQENVELVHNAFDAFIRGDIEGVLRLCDENILITQPQELPGVSRHQRGYSGVLEAFGIWPEQWDDYQIQILRTADLGDYVVATTQTRGRGKQSGVEVEMDFSFVFIVRAERIVEMQIFIREDQALEAARLREQAMSQENVDTFA